MPGDGTLFLMALSENVKEMMSVDGINEETTRMVGRIVVLRLSTKHINLWIRQLEMKRIEMCELEGVDEV